MDYRDQTEAALAAERDAMEERVTRTLERLEDRYEKQLGSLRVKCADLEHRLSMATADPESQASQLLSKHNALLMAARSADELGGDLLRAQETWSEEIDEAQQRIAQLEAELRKYEPSDGEMHQRLGMLLAIKEAASLLDSLPRAPWEPITGWRARQSAWLDLPVVAQARKMP